MVRGQDGKRGSQQDSKMVRQKVSETVRCKRVRMKDSKTDSKLVRQ